MADEQPKKPEPSMFGAWEPVVFIVGIIAALFLVAWYRGTLGNLGGQGILQAPLPPVGSGSTYNPANAPVPGVQGVGAPATTSTSTSTNR
jgi:hypothetical protein